MPKIYDSIVIGGGPAGMTAALNLLRGGKSCLIIEKDNFGGQIASSPRVENIPGIMSISGLDFSNNLFEQISALGVEFELEEVTGLEKKDDIFTVHTNYGDHQAKTVVIAAGVTHNHIHVAREEDLIGHGVSYCATCDGAFFKDQEVALIGDANTALQYALVLSTYCKQVNIYTLFDRFFGDKILVDRVKATKNITYAHNLALQEFLGDPELEGLRFKNTQTNEDLTVKCKGVFIAIGLHPTNEIFGDLVELEKGYIVVDERKQTKTPGLYAIGDCTKKEVRQVATAANDGSIAANFAVNYLNTK